MNNRWRRQFQLEMGHKLNAFTKQMVIVDRKFQDYWCNLPMPSFRKGKKHYATKHR